MGSAKKIDFSEKSYDQGKVHNFRIMDGEKDFIHFTEGSPSNDYLIFRAIEPIKEFFAYFPVHLSHWMKTGEFSSSQIENERQKNKKKFPYLGNF
ncbi:MAG: hypothetical protein VX642_13025 [Bdellovibrionota bacterium]|nr:hypothetical protein [Bdellovibrionota bacterium]